MALELFTIVSSGSPARAQVAYSILSGHVLEGLPAMGGWSCLYLGSDQDVGHHNAGSCYTSKIFLSMAYNTRHTKLDCCLIIAGIWDATCWCILC